MKKLILRSICLILCLILVTVPVFAEGGSATLSNVSGVTGETVTMTVSLREFSNADAMAVVVSGLTPTGGSWLKESTLSDFNGTSGVWATSAPVDVNGDIFKLTFTVEKKASIYLP